MRNWCRGRVARLSGCSLIALTGVVATASSGAAAVPSPAVAPATGGGGLPVLATTQFDLAEVGYEQSEHVITGTASAFTTAAPLTADGMWTASPGETAPYVTRAVVYRPEDPKDFSGTVLVEWLNVSGGLDANPDWVQAHNQLIRDGHAWVGVSAQAVGVDATRTSDPDRYATLVHPGDSFSYDIFSQVGQAVRTNRDVLGGLEPDHVLAAGESQSAGRLVTYLNAVHPLAGVYDGFLVHSRGGGSAPLAQAPLTPIPAPNPVAIRRDLDEPVFVYQTETDVILSSLGSRQPETRRLRIWEAAGTAHYDEYGLTIGGLDVGDGQGAVDSLAAMQAPTSDPIPGIITCALPINTGPMHWQLGAVVDHLHRWVVDGTPPPKAPLIETTASAPVTFAVDDAGNALGGVRSPQVDVPIAQLGGVGNTGTGPLGRFCVLFGTTVPFTADEISARYRSHAAFVARWNDAVDDAVKAGYLVRADARELKRAAARSTIGG